MKEIYFLEDPLPTADAFYGMKIPYPVREYQDDSDERKPPPQPVMQQHQQQPPPKINKLKPYKSANIN
jgi:hypothetical protein